MSNQDAVATALVTGGGGFIGSHLVEQLLARGERVRALVRYTSTGTAGWLEGLLPAASDRLQVVFGDLRDPDAVERAVQGCSRVFHLGALIAIPYSYQNPREFVAVNVEGTQNVLEAARRHQTDRIVCVSTSEVYGSARYVPIDEDHPRVAQSPYAASKIAADALVHAYVRSFSLPAVIARPFNTYGPRQSLRAIVPTVLAQALDGGNLQLGNLTPTRDLNYVADTAAGLLACGYTAGIEGEEFNLGSGREIAIRELAEQACALAGVPCRIQTREHRVRPASSEVDRLLANADKARDRLAWQPAVTLEDGLQSTLAWLRQQEPGRWVREMQL